MTVSNLGLMLGSAAASAFVALWFYTCWRKLSAWHRVLESIGAQVWLHRRLCMQERGGASDQAARRILDSKLTAYRETAKGYDRLLRTPLYRIPAFLMGFRPAKKEGEV